MTDFQMQIHRVDCKIYAEPVFSIRSIVKSLQSVVRENSVSDKCLRIFIHINRNISVPIKNSIRKS